LPNGFHREPRDLVRDLAGELLAERPLDALVEEAAQNPLLTDALIMGGLLARDIDYGEAYNLLNEVRGKRSRKTV
jgi:hypothetical protein